jgi:hypothetical protein
MSEQTATVEATPQTALATPVTTPTPAASAPTASTVQSPVSTTKPSILSDAGKPAAEAPVADKSILDEAKTEGEEKAEDAQKKVVPPTVPEKYDIKLPEGMMMDEAKLAEFTPLAKELGLSNEGVQKLVDFQANVLKKASDEQAQNFHSIQEEFRQETIKEYGPKLKEELVYVARGRDNIASKEAIELINQAGLANNKEIIRMFSKAGRMLSEDKRVDGPTHVNAGMTPGQVVYGDTHKPNGN